MSRIFNMDGHACVLRMICETAETPFHTDGLLGEAVNLLLLPAHILERVPAYGESDYLEALNRKHLMTTA